MYNITIVKWICSWLKGSYSVLHRKMSCLSGEWSPVVFLWDQPYDPTCLTFLLVMLILELDVSSWNLQTKLSYVGTSSMEEDQISIQEDLENLTKWSIRNRVKFSSVKCKVIHLQLYNTNFIYNMGLTDRRPLKNRGTWVH